MLTEHSDGTAEYASAISKVELYLDPWMDDQYQVIISDARQLHRLVHDVDPVSGRTLQTWTDIKPSWEVRDVSDLYKDLDEARNEFDRVVSEEIAAHEALDELPTVRPAQETRRRAEAYDALTAEVERLRTELDTYRAAVGARIPETRA